MRNKANSIWRNRRSIIPVEEFDQFVELPENTDKLFEYIGGKIVEMPSNPYASEISSNLNYLVRSFLKQSTIKGYVTGEAGGYMVSGERYAPDVGFIYKAKGALAKSGYNPNPPDLAVEVDFPSTDASRDTLRIKIANYLAAGTMVWVVAAEAKHVEIYLPGEPVKVIGFDGALDGGDVLPGFTLAVKDIFPAKRRQDHDGGTRSALKLFVSLSALRLCVESFVFHPLR